MENIEISKYLYDRETSRKSIIDQGGNLVSAAFALYSTFVVIIRDQITTSFFMNIKNELMKEILVISYLVFILSFIIFWFGVLRPRQWSAGLPPDFEAKLCDTDGLSDVDKKMFCQYFISGYRKNSNINDARAINLRYSWNILLILFLSNCLLFAIHALWGPI